MNPEETYSVRDESVEAEILSLAEEIRGYAKEIVWCLGTIALTLLYIAFFK